MIYSTCIWEDVTVCDMIENLQDTDSYTVMVSRCEDRHGVIVRIALLGMFGVMDLHFTHIIYSIYKKIQNGEWVIASIYIHPYNEKLISEGAAIGRPAEEAQREEEKEKLIQKSLKPLDVEILDYTRSYEESSQL